MNCLRVRASLLSLSWFDRVDCVPAGVKHLLIAQPVENSIAAKHYEVMEVVSNRKLRYFRLSNNHTFFTPILGVLGLDVTKSARHREPSRNHSMRPQNEVLLWLVFSWQSHILDRLSLVNAASILDDPLHFILFVGSMVSREQEQLFAFVRRHNRSTVANICNITLFANDKNNYATAATTFMHWCLSVGVLHKPTFSFETTSSQCLCWVLWEALLVYNDQMELIFEEVRTCWATMAIIDSEIATLWPVTDIFPAGRSRHIQNDRYSIFIVISLDALMSVCCVRSDQTMCFRRILRRFKIFQRICDRSWLLEFNSHLWSWSKFCTLFCICLAHRIVVSLMIYLLVGFGFR